MRRPVLATTLAALLVLAGCLGGGTDVNPAPSGGAVSGDGGAAGASDSMGFAAGGAQDVNDFRNNLQAGYVPQPSSMTTVGLYHDHYFDTDQQRACNATFCPSYSRAVTRDPLSGDREQYLTVGLNSGINASEFERKSLNLVVVVDTSGSMDESFDSYYYDDGTRKEVEDATTKMAAARQAVSTLTTHLTSDDRIGVVSYDDSAETVVEMRRVGERDMDAVRDQIRSLHAGGGTNFDAGVSVAESMVRPYRNPDQTERETRIVYLTDAMPNRGTTDGSALRERLAENADDGVYSTFVGVGVDFNARFVETVNSVDGANHYVVRSPTAFRERMDEGFRNMVSPLVFDLSLRVDSDAYDVEAIYGSPAANEQTGELLHVDTLFPSRREDGKTEGGVVLVQLERNTSATRGDGTGGDATEPVTLTASYRTRDGKEHTTTRTVAFSERDAPYYESTGVRKAVVLARYSDLMRNWMAYERARAGSGSAADPADGVEHRDLGTWEQQSVALQVSPTYAERLREFREYFAAEASALDDPRLQRERKVIDALLAHAENSTDDTANGTDDAVVDPAPSFEVDARLAPTDVDADPLADDDAIDDAIVARSQRDESPPISRLVTR